MEKKTTQNIMSMDLDEIRIMVKKHGINVCVIGIGRIGLPTAITFANSGLPTIGVDINQELVDMINSGNFPLKDEPGYEQLFEEVIKTKKLIATTKIEDAVPNSDVIVLSLPTPMIDKIPNYSALQSVAEKLGNLIKKGSVIVVESTIEPGFVENELIGIIESSGTLKAKIDFVIGVCPENANPGEIFYDFNNRPRLVGGIDEKTTAIILEVYKHVFPVELVEMPDCKTANAVKLTTNVFRDINIAFINELALMFEKLGIDTMKVLDAAKRKYNFQVHYPGSGVGGPCLPINSYQLLNSARHVGVKLSMIESARKINENMSDHVVKLTSSAFKESNNSLQSSDILILGVSYKPNVKDIQLSPAEKIISKLQNLGTNVHIYDPYFSSDTVFGIKVEDNLDDILPKMDATIIVTDHDDFKNIKISSFTKMKNPILIDTRGIIDPSSAKLEKIIFRGLGRGNF